jgi:hypothetical protein
MHDPDPDLSILADEQIQLDCGLLEVLRVHSVCALEEIEPTFMTVAVEEHRNARKGGSVLPFGQPGSSAEHRGGPLCIVPVPQKVDVATDNVRRNQSVRQATLEVGSPDGYRLATDENDASLTHNVLKERDDPFGLGKAERQGCYVKYLRRLVHVPVATVLGSGERARGV